MDLNTNKRWSLRYTPGDSGADKEIFDIANGLGVSEVVARLLYNRGYSDVAMAERFLDASVTELHDPYEMADMRHAVLRISNAIALGEKITIYGDYDVDGVTSVTLLYTYLRDLGADVDYYIPVRAKEGYGISLGALDTVKAQGTKLIITVDTGITAVKEAEYASELGMDMVVTDHHECHGELPCACAVVNPHRPDCPYPFKELAGVGVVFKLVCACEIMRCSELSAFECVQSVVERYVDLAAIGTVADVMPLVDENRIIVKMGLAAINDTERCGLAALIEAATRPNVTAEKYPTKKRKINSGFISFSLAPRINAAGRISSASKAVELLLEEDAEAAAFMADELCDINAERQRQENCIAEQAYAMIEKTCDLENDRVIVLDNDSWQQGIIGIVSSRITEKYGLTSILISFDGAVDGEPLGTDVGKGSGRSVKGINLVGALDYCRDLLVQFGGHELAAGLSVRRSNIPLFRERINEYARQHLGESALIPSIEADCEISADEISLSTAEEIARLEPFGVANPAPVFMLRSMTLDKIVSMGSGKHTKLMLSCGESVFQAVYFGVAASTIDLYPGEQVDVMCQLAVNEFRGTSSVQLIVQDLRLSEETVKQYKTEKSDFEKIQNGERFCASMDILPTRAQIADVYKFFRYENTCGRTLFNHRMLSRNISRQVGYHINGVKLRLILRILEDMNVCDVDEQNNDYFYLEVFKNAAKTNIESSDTYKRLVAQCAN